MLNYTQCYFPDRSWYAIKFHISQFMLSHSSWTTGIIAIGLIALGLLTLPWIWSRIKGVAPRPWFSQKHSLMRLGVGVCLGCLLVISPLGISWLNQKLLQTLPKHFEAPADAIVILGRGLSQNPYRVDAAIALWRRESVPLIFASGYEDGPAMAKLLAQKGVPKDNLDGENCSSTTEENAQFAAFILEPMGIKRIYLVSDSPHLLRAFLTFRSFGFEVVAVAADSPIQPERKRQIISLLAEYGGIVVYALKGRFFPRAPANPLAHVVSSSHATNTGLPSAHG
jgi:uncharacterized SAM-binding protein YcdF (DUF218 family)